VFFDVAERDEADHEKDYTDSEAKVTLIMLIKIFIFIILMMLFLIDFI
jgi:hypothetical protein